MSDASEAHQPADSRAVAGEPRGQAAWSRVPSRPSGTYTEDELRPVAGGDTEASDRRDAGSAGPVLGETQGGADDAPGGSAAATGRTDDAPGGSAGTPAAADDAPGGSAGAPAAADDQAEPVDSAPPVGVPGAPSGTVEAAGTGDEPGADDQAGEPDPLVEACRQRDEYLDALRRLQADFENYRKRVQRQQEESVSRAGDRLVLSILPALDAFDLAAAHLVGDDQLSPGGFIQAVALLRDTLAKEGLEQVGSVGDPFDPTAHEAVEHVDDGGEAGPVVDTVLRAGYRFGGRVIRPAMVKVRG